MTVTELRLVHKHENKVSANAHVPRARGPHSQTLAARQNSAISCSEDAKALTRFVTFAATVRSVSPSLEMMINFCYLHCRPGGLLHGHHTFVISTALFFKWRWNRMYSPQGLPLHHSFEHRGRGEKMYLLVIKQPRQHGAAATVTQCTGGWLQ